MIKGILGKSSEDSNVYFLELVEECDSVVLRAVDGKGVWVSDILSIPFGEDGVIELNTSVDSSVGIRLDKDGSVVTKKEGY